jgi:hypothetical protein
LLDQLFHQLVDDPIVGVRHRVGLLLGRWNAYTARAAPPYPLAGRAAHPSGTQTEFPDVRVHHRGTVKVRVFPNIDAPLRLVSAVLVEIDEKWAASTQPYIKWKPDTASTV